jgi:arabinogalactan endo-1,4-beta-galactosidase
MENAGFIVSDLDQPDIRQLLSHESWIIFFHFLILFSCTMAHSQGGMDRMILGADISYVDQEEHWGISFYDHGEKQSALTFFEDHGFTYIRLRLFVSPNSNDHYQGYNIASGHPEEFCGLNRSIAFAQRIKDQGFRFLLNLHYRDIWADPGKQYKPNAWWNLSLAELKTQVYDYTRDSLQAFASAGVYPDMVQVGNEVGLGFLWDDDPTKSGSYAQWDNFTALLKQGVQAVRDHAPGAEIMIHHHHSSSLSWYQDLEASAVEFDVIGVSYYPQFGGDPETLKADLLALAENFDQDIFVVEYSGDKEEVFQALRSIPDRQGKGPFIWEPITWNEGENLFSWQDGLLTGHHTNALMDLYPSIANR